MEEKELPSSSVTTTTTGSDTNNVMITQIATLLIQMEQRMKSMEESMDQMNRKQDFLIGRITELSNNSSNSSINIPHSPIRGGPI